MGLRQLQVRYLEMMMELRCNVNNARGDDELD